MEWREAFSEMRFPSGFPEPMQDHRLMPQWIIRSPHDNDDSLIAAELFRSKKKMDITLDEFYDLLMEQQEQM